MNPLPYLIVSGLSALGSVVTILLVLRSDRRAAETTAKAERERHLAAR